MSRTVAEKCLINETSDRHNQAKSITPLQF